MSLSRLLIGTYICLFSMATSGSLLAQATFEPLPDLGFGGFVNDVSSQGVVVGGVSIDASNSLVPAVWRDLDSPPQLLPTNNFGGYANAMNASGTVVGVRYGRFGASASPVYWVDGVMKDLPTLGGGGQALDINNAGVIVGYVRSGDGQLPAVWRNDELKVLPIPGIGTADSVIFGTATGVNSSGTIVGVVSVAPGSESVSLKWENDLFRVASRASWIETRGVDIDDAGNVLVNGYFGLTGPFSIATLASDDAANFFRPPDTSLDVWGTAIANGGLVTGYYYDFSTVPAGLQAGAWRNDDFFSLARPAGMKWAFPTGISEGGLVVGYVSDGVTGSSVPGYWNLDGLTADETEIELNSIAGFPGETVVLAARVTEDDQNLPGETVTFEMGNSIIGSAVSDTLGMARLRFAIPTGAKAGGHAITASTADGIEDDASLDVKWVPTVTNLVRSTARPGQTVQANGTLTNALNRAPLRNQTVVMRIQGADYTTRSNGEGRFSISYRVPRNARRGSAIPVQATFPGNSNHSRSAMQSSIRIR